MFASAYNKLFWAMIFIIFDFHLGPINILPGFIGYLLFYSGLSKLAEQHETFLKGKIISVLLTLLTIKDIIKSPDNLFMAGQFGPASIISMVIGAITSALNLYLIYIACRGIYLVCEERDLKDLMVRAVDTWKFYLVISCIMMLYLPFSINVSRDYAIFGILGVIINIAASLGIAQLFRKTKLQFEEQA